VSAHRSENPLSPFDVRPLAGVPYRLFSVDVEEWFHSNFQSAPRLDTRAFVRRAGEGVRAALDLLDQTGSRATFFVLGSLAEEQPDLVRTIARRGHEIGCHSYTHTLLYEQSRDTVARDLARARDVLSQLSGQPVLGFRAPSWSITERNLEALDVIAEAGFRYDSSIFPARTYLYGIAGAPRTAYRLRTPAGNELVEVPPSTIAVGPLRLGVGGGVYLRAFPQFVHEAALRRTVKRGAPFVAYVHPRELDPGAWALSLPLSLKERLIHDGGLPLGAARVRALLALGGWRALDVLLGA
jgi:polysaccharide deacetylase family protein (PEP-CTERM system associated)